MDPYRMLGVTRGCTREEVKAAFRAMVPSVHPDRGGEDLTFIQIRAAYEQILAEADTHQKFGISRPSKVPHDEVIAERPDPAAARNMYTDWLRSVSAKSLRRRRKWVGTLGAIFLLYLVFLIPAAGLCQAVVFILELENNIRRFGWNPDSVGFYVFVADNLTSIYSACLVMWIYNPN